MEKGYKNLGFWMMLLIPFTFLGFYKSYFIQVPDFEPENDVYIHLHALFSSLWIILLIVQPLLIRNKNYKLHRTLGKASYLLFPLLMLSMLHPVYSSYEKGGSMVMPVFNLILIVLFYTLSIINKKKMDLHMRYMIGIALVFVTPTLGRVTIFWFGFDRYWMFGTVWTAINLLLLGLLMADMRKGKGGSAYLVVLIGFVVYQIALFLF